MTISNLYYECHVIIEPIFDEEKLKQLKLICKRFGFRLADLLMQKRKEDTPERNKNDTFCTSHDSDLKKYTNNLVMLVMTLQNNNFKVWRYKIEDVVIDSRTEDILKLL